MLNFGSQSTLARLLAKENISVQHGNYRTAFFDVKGRVLGLPLWKNFGKDVYDMLVGHEVGHALYTPADGWHNSTKDVPDVPRSYLNVVEDIRIEKKIQRAYPGIVGSFKRGYRVLSDNDFFGIADKDVNRLSLMDRLNLKSKLRDLIEVDFSPIEMPLVQRALNVETWQDVLDVCRDLHAFIEEHKDEYIEEQLQIDIQQFGNEGDEYDDSDFESSESENEGENQDDAAQARGKPSTESDESSEDESKDNSRVKRAGKTYDPHQVTTDEAYRSNESKLLDTDNKGYQPKYVKAVTRKQVEEIVIPYKEVLRYRDIEARKGFYRSVEDGDRETQFAKFNESTKKFTNLMAKEFEMRKMAYRYSRSQTSRSGSLNVDKLYSYKYNDDIFNRVTRLADAKSHGLVMMIDYSGSMESVLSDVIQQTLTLASFCKKVNIPFEVYSFTSGAGVRVYDNADDYYGTDANERMTPNNGVYCASTQIVQLLTSNMKKDEYARGYRDLFMQSYERSNRFAYSGKHNAKFEQLSGTPLNETLMASRFILRDFKAKTNVQKVNFILLTDGDGHTITYKKEHIDGQASVPTKGIALDVDGDILSCVAKNDMTELLLNQLRKEFTVVGYFLASSSYEMRGKVWASHTGYVSDKEMNDIRRDFNRNKFISYDSVLGYDRFFIIKAEKASLSIEDDEFEVDEFASKGQIQKAFMKHTSSKKANKLFATRFAEMVS